MNWTYQQYMSQPDWLIKLLKLKMELDGQWQQAQAEKMESDNNGSR